MNKHTDGNWIVGFAINNDGGIAVKTDEGQRIAVVDCQSEVKRGKGHESQCAERSANARLIAAAPELLDALILCREEMNRLPRSLGYDFTHIPKIDAAIAKARGEA